MSDIPDKQIRSTNAALYRALKELAPGCLVVTTSQFRAIYRHPLPRRGYLYARASVDFDDGRVVRLQSTFFESDAVTRALTRSGKPLASVEQEWFARQVRAAWLSGHFERYQKWISAMRTAREIRWWPLGERYMEVKANLDLRLRELAELGPEFAAISEFLETEEAESK